MPDANGVSLSIGGGAELERRLKGLSEEVVKRLALRAARAGSRLMKDAIAAAAPLGPGKAKLRRTRSGDLVVADYGHLRDNIRMRLPSKRARSGAEAGGLFEFIITTGQAFWGRFLEEGTAKMAPRPWMRPAFDATADPATDRVGEVLKTGIDAWVRKNGGG